MEVVGYSERGVINSLFHEIKYSQNNIELLNEFLSLISFPSCRINYQISDAKILMEQSFSGFGSPDIILMVNNNEKKQAIFIEVKVKAFQHWNISEEFNKFESKRGESNLFTQLHRMVQLIKALQTHLSQQSNKFERELFLQANKKIGAHKIVLDAVEQLAHYCSDAFFVALVPDDNSKLSTFYQLTLKGYTPKDSKGLDVKNWGYISWADIEKFCEKNNLGETLKVFKFNEGQIYERKKRGNSR